MKRELSVPGIAYGGDYNPEQWPEEVWAEDMRLMREAGVTMVSVGIFSWALLEPKEGAYDFSLLDKVLDLLHGHGIAADLATPTAAPPAWFFKAHPEALPVDKDGRRLSYGSRQTFCASSPAYREAALRMVGEISRRYADHPAVAMWHVHNEYGCHNAECYCDESAAAFRRWLRARYEDDLDALNDAWGTRFWSQWYYDWDEILPPRPTGASPAGGWGWGRRRFS
ncbi:beta-galactosidase, partial [Streptomyces muensis]